MQLFRYADRSQCRTPLDPLDDCTAWFRGLSSRDYTAELLQARHGFTDATRTRSCTRAIAAHADSAVDLLEQAFSGPARTSYLPIYYAMLNLAKVVVLCKGWLSELQTQRVHGASWSGIRRASQDLLTDHITLQERGAIGLFYRALVGELWPRSRRKDRNGKWVYTHQRRVVLRSLYPYINSVSFEYRTAYGEERRMTAIEASLQQAGTGKWRVEAAFPDIGLPTGQAKREFRILSGLTEEHGKYVSRSVSASDPSGARASLANDFRWFLLCSVPGSLGTSYTLTPRSSSSLLLPEEIPCLLVFFHLSNVVRYDPERLARLLDSKARGMLEALRRHATYSYMLAVWSYLMQAQVLPVAV